jgi:hypothetical protein
VPGPGETAELKPEGSESNKQEEDKLPRTSGGSHHHVLVFSTLLLALGVFILLGDMMIHRYSSK